MIEANLNGLREGGFSLLELIVVLAIIGVMVSVIGVSMGRDADRLARLESERFLVIVNEVRDEAILSGESYFLELNEKTARYRFETVAGENDGLGFLKPRSVERGVKLLWDVLEDIAQDDAEQSEPVRALISPLGEITPFSAVFLGDEFAYEVFVDDENKLRREEKNAAAF